jgi:3-hydroxymyristoyl/3-hydroxydecanoyl-(acyl carrier protein) dehydratase
MKTKPSVLSSIRSENGVELLLKIDADILYFSGHFEGRPILPGVAQLDWVVFFAKKYLKVFPFFDGMEVIKFQAPVLPCYELTLILKWDAEKKKLYFTYLSKYGQHASGRIRLRDDHV